MAEVHKDHLHVSLNKLCLCRSNAQDEVTFTCFQAAQPLEPILDRYSILFHTYQSELFMQFWKSKLREIYKSKTELTFSEVVTKIWNPVFSECCQLVESVKFKSIKLRDVDNYFRPLKDNFVYEYLLNLHKALEACHGKSTDLGQWVRSAVNHMEQYWSLCEQAEAASIVLELKSSLALTGDFKTIEDVAGKVTLSMQEAPLESIDEKLISAKSFLETFTSDKRKLDCLKGFAACMNVVEWIRKESTGQYYRVL